MKAEIDMYDFNGEFAQTYTKMCSACDSQVSISTQAEDALGHHTSVYIMCKCGNSVGFRIPAN